MIEVYDDVCSYDDNVKLYRTLLNGNYEYGEYDMPHHPPTGLISPINQQSQTFIQLLEYFLQLDNPSSNNLLSVVQNHSKDLLDGRNVLIRPYVNLFLPNERPFFHSDGKVITSMFYFNPLYDIDEGGETQFFIDDQITGVLPKPSRLVIFDGTVLHRATSFRTKPRITAVIKFKVD